MTPRRSDGLSLARCAAASTSDVRSGAHSPRRHLRHMEKVLSMQNRYLSPMDEPLIDRIRIKFEGVVEGIAVEKRWLGFKYGPWSTFYIDTIGM